MRHQIAKIKPRARNLDDDSIEKIVQILDGWNGKLTWDLLIIQIEKVIHNKYTRQALDKHGRIKVAYNLRKVALGKPDRKVIENKSPEMQAAMQRIARLEAENERLKLENNSLLNQFIRWAYNAHSRGLDQAFLNNPLPSNSRKRSDKPYMVKGTQKS